MTDSTEQTPPLLKRMAKRWSRMLFLIVVFATGAVSILCLMQPRIVAIKSNALSDEAVEPSAIDSLDSLQLGRIEGKRNYRKLPFLVVDCLNLDVRRNRLVLSDNLVQLGELDATLSMAVSKDGPKAIYVWVGIDTRDGEMEQVRSIVEGVSKRTNTPHLYCHAGAFTIFVDDDELRSENELP